MTQLIGSSKSSDSLTNPAIRVLTGYTGPLQGPQHVSESPPWVDDPGRSDTLEEASVDVGIRIRWLVRSTLKTSGMSQLQGNVLALTDINEADHVRANERLAARTDGDFDASRCGTNWNGHFERLRCYHLYLLKFISCKHDEQAKRTSPETEVCPKLTCKPSWKLSPTMTTTVPP